jgi:serine/threonine-protein kinase
MSHPVTRLNAALEGRYRIERELGEGGMATVYLADDVRHERKVALKVLKPELAAVVGAERFLAEIKTTANLQHPNILPLFDSGEADGFLFYVMPFVEGESLRERLGREQQLPVDEAIRITLDVAEALQAAHDQGVIHRDIKPANILLSRGRPLVADFGIALAVSAAGGGRLTETGLSMGTPFYMSPEQASADRVPSASSDVYSLGCVLYEMLIGEPPYTGPSAQAVLAKILTEDARQPTAIRASIPSNVDAALRCALQKLPADRFASAQGFADALTSPRYQFGDAALASASAARSWKPFALGSGVLAVLLAVALGFSVLSRGAEVSRTARFTMVFQTGQGLVPGTPWVEFDLAPDGSSFAYVGPANAGGTQIWQRRLDDIEPHPVNGTQNGLSPAFSPDGQSIVFFAEGGLSVASLAGGPPFRLVAEGGLGGATWSSDGWVYYASGQGAILRVLAAGGEPEEVVPPPEEGIYRMPRGLPGGQTILATLANGPPTNSRIVGIDLETKEVHDLVTGAMARYSSSEHLLYTAADGTLMVAPFDASRLELMSSPVAMIPGVQVKGGSQSQFSLSEDGSLLYKTGPPQTGLFQAVWVTREGTVDPVDSEWKFDGSSPSSSGAAEIGVAVSPDGTRLALKVHSDAGEDIWVKQLDRGPLSRLTFHEDLDRRPRWSPDGQRIMFVSERGENRDLWERMADGTGTPQLLLDLEQPILEVQRNPDETWFVLRLGGAANVTGGRDIVGIQVGDSVTVPLAAEEYDEKSLALSPNGRWLAYESTETGQDEIYVRPFPDVDAGKWQVSTNGGIAPRWAPSGDELYYVNADRFLTAVGVEAVGGSLQVGERIPLFNVDERALNVITNYAFYDVAPDGRFLMVRFDVGEGDTNQLILAMNWWEEVGQRVGR